MTLALEWHAANRAKRAEYLAKWYAETSISHVLLV